MGNIKYNAEKIKKPKNRVLPYLAIIWQKKLPRMKMNQNTQKYIDIVEVVKHFGVGLRRMSDYSQNSQKQHTNGPHPTLTKVIKFWLIFSICTHFSAQLQK